MYIVQVQVQVDIQDKYKFINRYKYVKVHLVYVASNRVADRLSEFGHAPSKNLVPFVTI